MSKKKDFRPRLSGQKKKAYLNLTKDEKRLKKKSSNFKKKSLMFGC